jgi:transcriptional regulator with XRE-family HTH domain
VSEVGKRLRAAREAKGLSVRKFADRFDEDPHALSNIEAGRRFPPRQRIKKFAELLSLTPEQLEALIAVERRGLDTNQMLPEIPPAPMSLAAIEAAAEMVLSEFRSQHRGNVFDGPIPIEEMVKSIDGLSLENLDFEKDDSIGTDGSKLYGCFYPENFHGKSRVVLVNTGRVNGRRLSPIEKRITIAHELGHYFLHYGPKESKQLLFRFSRRPTYCREAEIHPNEFNSKENQANLFGACLLMPKQPFNDQWGKMAGDPSRLAKYFSVTEDFVLMRGPKPSDSKPTTAC